MSSTTTAPPEISLPHYRKNGKVFKAPKSASFKPGLKSARPTFAERQVLRQAAAITKAKEAELRDEKKAEKEEKAQRAKEKREKAEEKARMAKLQEKMHKKRVERLKRREKRNKALRER